MSTYDEWKTRTPDEGGPSPDERHDLAANGVETCACGAMLSNTDRIVICWYCLSTFLANLAIAAGLCAAWQYGFDARWNAMLGGALAEEWRPNATGKPAPNWRTNVR